MTSSATSGRHLSKFKKRPKMPHSTTLCQISPERFMRVSRNFTHLSGIVSPTKVPDRTKLAASGRLQNAIKSAQKCAGKESNNSDTAQCKITKFIMDIQAEIVYSQTGYCVISYFRLTFTEVRKTTGIAASDGWWPNFSSAASCLLHQLVGFLLTPVDGLIYNSYTYICRKETRRQVNDCEIAHESLTSHASPSTNNMPVGEHDHTITRCI